MNVETTPSLILNRAPVGNSENLVWLSPHIRRIVANNPSPLTFTGTNTYIVGVGKCTIIDPGPELDVHYEAIINAVFSEKIEQILITHRHKDHCGLAKKLASKLNCPITAIPLAQRKIYENLQTELNFDTDLMPDIPLQDGQIIGNSTPFRVIHTAGHTPDHACFALENENVIFSGDHIMGWSSTVIAPPLGAMGDYYASLEKLLNRPENLYLSGHGAEILNPRDFVHSLYTHRKQREAQIIELLETGAFTLNSPTFVSTSQSFASEAWTGGVGGGGFLSKEEYPPQSHMRLTAPPQVGSTPNFKDGRFDLDALTRAIYGNISPALFPAARATTQAHVEWIVGSN